jgi:hypothetical protein
MRSQEDVATKVKYVLRNSLSSVTIGKSSAPTDALLEYLEFEDPRYYNAFWVSPLGKSIVGRNGERIKADYLFRQWESGKDAGALRHLQPVQTFQDIWDVPTPERRVLIKKWNEIVFRDEARGLATQIIKHNKAIDDRDVASNRGNAAIMRTKRIIACTTTGAAKYRDDLLATAPQVLLVEEAGEILESHIISSIGLSVEQLILIGDHKQLRPKISNYKLTVEKGEGFDLNRSLFERLIIQEYPHHTLCQQHRMRPEISQMVREMTYPDLTDASRTTGRLNIRGLQKNVIFFNHSHDEDFSKDTKERTRTNKTEAELVLRIVKYLGQQGYGNESLVVLTPYLGQLSLLRKIFSADHDPLLNDFDVGDLAKAGLASGIPTPRSGTPIRLATIGE